MPITSTATLPLLFRAPARTPAGRATVDEGSLELVGDADRQATVKGSPVSSTSSGAFCMGTIGLLYMPRQQLLELYDIAHDPRERKNLVDAEPQLASQMLDRLFQLNNEPRQ